MARSNKEAIPNQVFVGLPWKNVRQKYDRIIRELEKKFPLHFTIVGRDDSQDATNLFALIKERIASSSCAVFDATGGNANVSLEYGYAEGIEVPLFLFLSAHKAAQKNRVENPIISDLVGTRRVEYKTERTLSVELHKLCREHDYTKRFEKAVTLAARGKRQGPKKRTRTLTRKIIRVLDGKKKVRRADLILELQTQGYSKIETGKTLKKLHDSGVVNCKVGRFSEVSVA